jgi:hypothetical protein
LANIARLFQFECPDFNLIFCNVIFIFFHFFLSRNFARSFSGSQCFSSSPSSCAGGINSDNPCPCVHLGEYLSVFFACLFACFFFFPPFHLLQWTLVWLASRSSWLLAQFHFFFRHFLVFLVTSDRYLVRSDYAVGIRFFSSSPSSTSFCSVHRQIV